MSIEDLQNGHIADLLMPITAARSQGNSGNKTIMSFKYSLQSFQGANLSLVLVPPRRLLDLRFP